MLASSAALDKFVAHVSEIGVVAFVKEGSTEASTFKTLADQVRRDDEGDGR